MDSYNHDSDPASGYNFSSQPHHSLVTANLPQDYFYANQELDDCLSGESRSWDGQFSAYPATGYYEPQQMQSYSQLLHHIKPTTTTLHIALANEFSRHATASPVIENDAPTDSANGSEQQPQESVIAKCKRGRPRKGNNKTLTSQEEEAKRSHFLERNRVAASKCREKKKSENEDMKAKYTDLKDMNDALRVETLQLQKGIAELKSQIFVHGKCGQCGHQGTDDYIQMAMASPKAMNVSSISRQDPTSAVDNFLPDDFSDLSWTFSSSRQSSSDVAGGVSPMQSGMDLQQVLPQLPGLDCRPSSLLSRDSFRGSADMRNDDSGISVGSLVSDVEPLVDEEFNSLSSKSSMNLMMSSPRAAKDFLSLSSHFANDFIV